EDKKVKRGEVVAKIDYSKPPAKTELPEKKAAAAKPAVTAPQKSTSSDVLSPAVRRIVEEEKLEPAKISGTGKGGRLTKGDVLAAAENRGADANVQAASQDKIDNRQDRQS